MSFRLENEGRSALSNINRPNKYLIASLTCRVLGSGGAQFHTAEVETSRF
jgi:hypothetical protein